MRIFLIRHAETSWNIGDTKFRGQMDIELSERGIQQADLLGQALMNEKIDTIYYGPLTRTQQTAEEIKKYHSNTVFFLESLLIDITFGDWEGKTHKEIFQENPGIEDLWFNHPELLDFPNGENWYDVFKRINLLFNKLRKSEQQTIVLVTHRVVINIILLYILKLDMSHFWDFQIDTASITEIVLEKGDFKIIRTNDIHHLYNKKEKIP